MASQEVSKPFQYQQAINEIVQATWMETGGDNAEGLSAPARESLSGPDQTFHPHRRVINLTLGGTLLTAAKVFGPHLAVNFIGETFGWNPAVRTAVSSSWAMLQTLRRFGPIRF